MIGFCKMYFSFIKKGKKWIENKTFETISGW